MRSLPQSHRITTGRPWLRHIVLLSKAACLNTVSPYSQTTFVPRRVQKEYCHSIGKSFINFH